MKKWILIGAGILTISVSLWAKPLQIVTVSEDLAAITREIAGAHGEVKSLVSGSHDFHHVIPRPSMAFVLRDTDLLIRIGMGLDIWVDPLIQAARNPKIFTGRSGYLDASEGTPKLGVPTGKIDGRMGDVHAQGNPHYWLSPYNGLRIAAHIREKLVELDPAHAVDYERNYRAFNARLNTDIVRWTQRLTPLRRAYFVTYHDSWAYFADAFGLTIVGQLEPLPGISPTAQHLHALKLRLATLPNRIVLLDSYYPQAVGQRFAKETGSRLVVVPTNVGDVGIQTYSELFDMIVNKLQP